MRKKSKSSILIIPSLFGFSPLKVSAVVPAAVEVSRNIKGETSTAAVFSEHYVPQFSRTDQRTFIPQCTLSPTGLHIYSTPEDGYRRTQRFEDNKKNLRSNKHKGELSDKAVKRIKNAIEWLLIRSNPKPVWNRQQEKLMFFRLNFITLTLPAEQQHSDKEITAVCLNNFLNILRNRFKVTDYLWKAEPQGCGNIHFHITTNTFIHYKDVAAAWESSVNLLGYIDRFHSKFHHRHPPCSNVQKVKHIRKLAGYLSKYMAKNKSFAPIGELRKIGKRIIEVPYTSKAYHDEKANGKAGVVIGTVLSDKLRPIESNLWGCSRSISQCKTLRFTRNDVQWESIRKLSFSSLLKKVPGNYVDSYYGPILSAAKILSPGLYEDMLLHAKLQPVDYSFNDSKQLQYL